MAVASGKGGVGKSTVAVNLAVSLARQGHRTGLLDADIYGPSLPRMLGLSRKPEVRGDKMIPLQAWGLSCMSIGFLVDEETPMIWRGPMVMGALEQMMGQVEWGALDILVVDMPPGTGDAQLTMAQRVALTGAVIVSTPQDIALIDARRGVRMFERTRVPVLGLVENMSFFCCPDCGHRAEIFGHGGARLEAQRLGTEFLGEMPLLLDIRTASDAGTPIAASAPDSEAAKAFAALARGCGRRWPAPRWRAAAGRGSSSSERPAAALHKPGLPEPLDKVVVRESLRSRAASALFIWRRLGHRFSRRLRLRLRLANRLWRQVLLGRRGPRFIVRRHPEQSLP